VRVAVFGVIFATGLELLGAVLYSSAFNGPRPSVILYLSIAAASFVFVLVTFLRTARVRSTAALEAR
jgi:hypothetical protein